MINILVILFQFKQRGYVDPVLDRRTATTTGHMLYQRIDPKPIPIVIPDEVPPTPPSPSVAAANRRRQVKNELLKLNLFI